MKINYFPKISDAIGRMFRKKQYKVTPVPSKPTSGFGKYLNPPAQVRGKVSTVAMRRRKRSYA